MILTEAEALGIKWCPVSRVLGDNRATTDNNPTTNRCIASQCMMWAWMTPEDPSGTERYGCCGLAMGARMGQK